MADEFNLNDALMGQTNASGQQNQAGQNWNNPWGGPGQPYPGGYAPPGPGQQYPGAPAGGQQYPGGYPAPGQQYPGAPPAGQQYPGGYPGPGQQYPGAPPGGQQYPAGFPGYPGFPAPGQQYPGAPVPGQPTEPKSADQPSPIPSAPTGPLKMPYSLPLSAGVVPGLVMTFNGVVNPSCKRWNIDIRKDNEIVFHFNPRTDENPNVIVCNSFFRGVWGREERTTSKFPFKKSQQFMVQIFCEQDAFRVTCNNEQLLQYKHRNKDFSQMKTVHVNGDITLNGATVNMM